MIARCLMVLGLAAIARPLAAQSAFPANVRDMGYCADVTSPTCIVRAYVPRGGASAAVGTGAYWLASADGRVCFVARAAYARVIPGRGWECIWRERQQ